jgi:hypothetical protein
LPTIALPFYKGLMQSSANLREYVGEDSRSFADKRFLLLGMSEDANSARRIIARI